MFLEPIVLLFSIYVALLYGILYLLFVAFPIIFQGKYSIYDSRLTYLEQRGWGAGIGGLAFVGIGIGTILGVACSPLVDKVYLSEMKKHAGGKSVWPEARLPPTFVGAILMPIALFWSFIPDCIELIIGLLGPAIRRCTGLGRCLLAFPLDSLRSCCF
jgi:hypothetical protein